MVITTASGNAAMVVLWHFLKFLVPSPLARVWNGCMTAATAMYSTSID